MIRKCQAIIIVQKGKGSSVQHRVARVEDYTTDESMDQDADTFSITLGDPQREMEDALDRDNEVEVNLFINDPRGNLVPIFTGMADTVNRDESYLLSITGRDTPSSLATDSDAIPQRWKNVAPNYFIKQQAQALGIKTTQIAKMSRINTLFTDGSETIWAFWYRIARLKGAYMWTNHLRGGTLIVDKLGYSLSPAYYFGDPPRGQARNEWQPIEHLTQISTKQGRVRQVIIHGMSAKKGKTPGHDLVAQSLDITIPDWKKQSVTVLTSTVDKTTEELQKRAKAEVFEAIVGAVEWQLTIHDNGQLIQQNKMCRINMPHYMPVGNYFIVGVTRAGGPDGLTQVVRVREKGFALSKRVPDPPVLAKTKTSVSADYIPPASISSALQSSDVRWADSFVRATKEYGGSWDFALFMGALLSMCSVETGFKNEREISSSVPSDENGVEWYQKPDGSDEPPAVHAQVPGKAPITVKPNVSDDIDLWHKRFANDPGNPDNPFRGRGTGNAGVGPMQLTDSSIKDFADNIGWNGAKSVGEYDGGRWNPDSNIRAAAKLLIDKANMAPPADPTNPDDIWIAVGRYNAYGAAGDAYRDKVEAAYNSTYGALALASISPPISKSEPPGTTATNINIPGHGQLVLPDDTPDVARKAIAFALRHLGDPYQSGGSGNPGYDCSSFVTASLAAGSGDLKAELDYPYPGHHGETTITLFKTGRFQSIPKDALKPADLVFFIGDGGTESAPNHVGMYLDDNLFIDDPETGKDVTVDSLGDDYWTSSYVGARRVVNWTNQADTTGADSNDGWLTKVGKFEVEKMPQKEGGTVDLTKPRIGVMHTTQGSTFTGAYNTLSGNVDFPTFMVGVEASGAVRIGQFYPFGTAARALVHSGDPQTNGWALAQIEIVGYSDTSPWVPGEPTFDALAALMGALSQPPWNIPLLRPALWGDTYDATGIVRRGSGEWGTATGWFGHIEVPENNHMDPGALEYSKLFAAAGG